MKRIAILFSEYLMVLLALWAASSTFLTFWMVLVWPACLVVIGTRKHALGIIGHWAMHGHLPKWAMWAAFVPVAIDPQVYRSSHSKHHADLGELGKDPEVEVVLENLGNWEEPAVKAAVLDALFLRPSEMLGVLTMLVSPKSMFIYGLLITFLLVFFGPAALLMPLSLGVLMAAHRCRARTEHDHLGDPGVTFEQEKPPKWKEFLFLQHDTWKHKEHHEHPSEILWNP